MAQQRGRSQARRNTGGGSGSGMPGWAWLVMGVLITLVLVLGGSRFLKSNGEGGFFRPKPNPDAQAQQPITTEEVAAEPVMAAPPAKPATASANTADYSFYEVLPKNEVRLSDEQLAAMAREEARRKAAAVKADTAHATTGTPLPQPIEGTQVAKAEAPKPVATPKPAEAVAATPAATPDATRAPAAATKADDAGGAAPVTVANVKATSGVEVPIAKTVPPTTATPYILQAGAYADAGQAENIKARIAMLGLNARVEAAEVGGKKVFRVRMGPYATAGELANAKSRLSSGGLAAMAVKAR